MRRNQNSVRCWSWPVLRAHHVRAVVILVTLVTLSTLFSTFSIRSGMESRLLWMAESARPDAGRQVMSADTRPVGDQISSDISTTPTSHSASTVVQARQSHHRPAIIKHLLKKQMKSQGYILPAPSALLKTRNLYQNRTVTREDITSTLAALNRTLEQNRLVLNNQVGRAEDVADFWNVSHPKRLLIVTTWRSGSTFLGQILSEHPGVYNHYEPLMHVGVEQIRPGDPRVDSVVLHLQDLLRCRYSNEDFLRKIQESMQDMLSHNAGVWQACVLGPNRNVCSLRGFLEQACHRFPAMTMKMVRLRLELTRQLLRDDPALRVVYLVRDPRATMNSRLSSVKWCSQSVDCIDPARLCADIHSDLDAFESLSADYPERLALVKYETLAKFPHATFRAVFDFAGLFYTQRIRQEVERHTSRDENHPWSTVRKSAERVDLWRRKLDRKSISTIESVCSAVLSRLGYHTSDSSSTNTTTGHQSTNTYL